MNKGSRPPNSSQTAIGKIFEIQRAIQDLHPFLEKVFPIAVADAGQFYIYDVEPSQSQYTLVKQAPTPMPVPQGVRAAFPLESYDNRMACVVTSEVFDSLEGLVTIFHEFIHCQQFETSEPGLKQSLSIAQKAQAANDFMWEIDHPFPYAETGFVQAYGSFLERTADPALGEVDQIRLQLKKLLSQEDYEYMVWQEWKEGFARFIENQVRIRLGLPENRGGKEHPYSRVSFYAGGAGWIRLLGNRQPQLTRDLEKLFRRMLSAYPDQV